MPPWLIKTGGIVEFFNKLGEPQKTVQFWSAMFPPPVDEFFCKIFSRGEVPRKVYLSYGILLISRLMFSSSPSIVGGLSS